MWKLYQPSSRCRIKCWQFLGTCLRHFTCPQAGDTDSKVVELSVGKVRGRRQCGIYGNDFYSFEGIPFAKPPLGPLRFRAPLPAEAWDSELDARQEKPIPLQMDRKTCEVIGSEDCLYLNVYTKHFDETKPPLPVMVYIYGGGFRTGGAIKSKYGPDYLMCKDVVYVLFNYRLCSLGFLSMPSSESNVPGNAGLQDQLLALQWVKEHIQKFNGDPENITLFGESAGAASVHFMMCLPQAKGLFHKAIMMSGSMLSPWVDAPEKESSFCRLAMAVGYEGPAEESSLLKFLQSVKAEKLIGHDLISARDRCFGFLNAFTPVVGGLIQAPFQQLMKEAWSCQVPLLLGGTSFEGLVCYPFCQENNGYVLDLLKEEPAMVLPYDLYQSMSVEERNIAADVLIKHHYGPRGITKSNITQILDLFSYKLFWHGIHRVVLSRLAHAQAPTYLYRFDFDSPKLNLMRNQLCGDDIKRGVCHADDLGYIFHKQGQKKQPLDSAEYLTIHRMVSILTTFARNGDPNCSETEPDYWFPVSTKAPFKVLNIGQEVECVTQAEKEGLEVWNSLYCNAK
ncbi:esterase B1 [Drosophila eugracilis]|uniref:esterase B1 n=1 Tax=Drosophila eugracilis TaxID=29029 RepID=UPI001BDB27A7|nr:esterase B1 [Drosophila eugracilis]